MTDSQSGGRGTAAKIRLAILLLLLLVAVGGLLYDRMMARPACDQAFELVNGMLEGKHPEGGDQTVSPEEVQQALARKPRRVEDIDRGIMEVYSWPKGLPWRSYDLYVVYLGEREYMLSSASKNQPPPGTLPAKQP